LEGKTIKVFWHKEGCFNTVRGKRLKDLESLKNMKERILSVKNAVWRWHVVLTFDDESLNFWFKLHKDVGRALNDYFNKVRNKFWGLKYFWKYEEGTKVWCKVCNKKVDFLYDMEREGWLFCIICGGHFKNVGERPHYHLLFDFVNRGIRCKTDKIDERLKKIKKKNVKRTELKKDSWLLEWKEKSCSELDLKKLLFPRNWDKFNWKSWFINLRKHKRNKSKDNLEILWGQWHYYKWGYTGGGGKKGGYKKAKFLSNGRTDASEIKTIGVLKRYVMKDFFKRSESKWLKDTVRRKWTHSLNLLYGKEVEYDVDVEVEAIMEGLLEAIGYFSGRETLGMVQETKDNMIDYYDGRGMVGEYIYNRVIDDIKGMVGVGIVSVGVEKEVKQKKLDVLMVGTLICRYCEKPFELDKGFIDIYCSKKCFYDYSKSVSFKEKKPLWVRRKDGSYDFK